MLGSEDVVFEGELLPELKRLSELEVTGLVDIVIVTESESGELLRVQAGKVTRRRRRAPDRLRSCLWDPTTEEIEKADRVDPAARLADLRVFVGHTAHGRSSTSSRAGAMVHRRADRASLGDPAKKCHSQHRGPEPRRRVDPYRDPVLQGLG